MDNLILPTQSFNTSKLQKRLKFVLLLDIIMDIQQPQNSSRQTQSLKNLITEILHTNTAYDCMPINSSVCSINKESSIFDAINIIINKNIEQLLVWDEGLNRWIWMLTIADAIRLIMHSLKTIVNEGKVNFRLFQKYREEGLLQFGTSRPQQLTKQQISLMTQTFHKTKISQLIIQINDLSKTKHHESHICDKQLAPDEPLYSSKKPPLPPSNQRPYIRLKSVIKESKLSFLIMAMIVQKIHRVLIQDIESKMIISILSFKDILLYLVRIANEAETEFYNKVTVGSLLENVQPKTISIQESRPLWEAFQLITDVYHSRWINVVDQNGRFKGLLFREDFRNIFKGWHIDYLWMSAGQFVKFKEQNCESKVPQYRFFHPNEIIKQAIWKIVTTKGNTLVWVDENDGYKVKATLGLLELFNLFVH